MAFEQKSFMRDTGRRARGIRVTMQFHLNQIKGPEDILNKAWL